MIFAILYYYTLNNVYFQIYSKMPHSYSTLFLSLSFIQARFSAISPLPIDNCTKLLRIDMALSMEPSLSSHFTLTIHASLDIRFRLKALPTDACFLRFFDACYASTLFIGFLARFRDDGLSTVGILSKI